MNKEGRAYNSAFSITSSDINSSRCQRPTEDRFWKSLPVTKTLASVQDWLEGHLWKSTVENCTTIDRNKQII